MASKKYTWLFTKTAEADVDDTLDYIANELHNPDAASSFAEKLEAQLDELCKSPKNGRLVENEYLVRDDIRRVLVDNYIAYYLIDESEYRVIVLRVVYGKRDQDKVVKNL